MDLIRTCFLYIVVDELALLKQDSELPFDDLLSQLPTDLIENIGKPLPFEEDGNTLNQDEVGGYEHLLRYVCVFVSNEI